MMSSTLKDCLQTKVCKDKMMNAKQGYLTQTSDTGLVLELKSGEQEAMQAFGREQEDESITNGKESIKLLHSEHGEFQDETITIEQESLQAPDGGWGWFVVLGSSIVHAIIGGFERSNGVMYLQLLARYNQGATATAWVLSLFSTLRLAMGPLASALCNKFSCRTVIYLGTAISSFGVLVSGFVPDLPYLYLTYGILGGVGNAFVYTPALILVGNYFSKKRGVAVGLATSGVAFGSFLLPPLTELLFNTYGFSGTFVILSGIMGNLFVCGALFRPLELHRRWLTLKRKKSSNQETATCDLLQGQCRSKKTGASTTYQTPKSVPTNEENISAFSDFRVANDTRNSKVGETLTSIVTDKRNRLLDLSLFRNFAFCTLCFQLFLFTFSLNSTYVFLPALAEDNGVTPVQGAYLVSILGILDGVSRLAMSSLLDLKLVKPYRLLIYNIVMFFVAIVSVLMPSMKGFWQFAVVSGLYGMLCGTYISQKSVVVVDVLGADSLSTALGFLLLFQGLSGLIGPTVGGLFRDYLGTYDMAFYFGSVGIAAGGFTMLAGNVWLYRKINKCNEYDPDR